MPDTVRTLAALQALHADNAAGDISAQDNRDLLVSVFPPEPEVTRVATVESTTSSSYADLATAGPAVTVTVGSSGILIVNLYSFIHNDGATTNGAAMAYALSGANTVAANDTHSLRCYPSNDTGRQSSYSATFVHTGLSAGSTTITAKYRRLEGNNGVFSNREVSAIAWGGDF